MGFTLFKWILFLSFAGVCKSQEQFISEFHMEDVKGSAKLSYSSDTKELKVTVKMSISMGKGVRFEIYPIWMEYDVEDKCSYLQLGDEAIGRGYTVITDFIEPNMEYTTSILNIASSVEGHSLVLRSTYANKTICAIIQKDVRYTTASAHFMGNFVNGYVYFRQASAAAMTMSITRVVTDLYVSDGTYYSLIWKISDAASSCYSITSAEMAKNLPIYNPANVTVTDDTSCKPATTNLCALGNLSGKFMDVLVGQSKGNVRKGYSDTSLPLSGESNVGNKLLIVYNHVSSAFACAIIKTYKTRNAIAKINHEGVTGNVKFSQSSPLDQTVVQVDIKGLALKAKGYRIHSWPTPHKIISGQDLCGSAVTGGHFNPYNKDVSSQRYPQPDASTDDMYEIGDLSAKYGILAKLSELSATYKDWNLPLFGANSIIGRSLVIHPDDSKSASRWVCTNIRPQYSVVTVQAIFKSPVIGKVSFMQEKGEPDTETSIFVQLDFNDGREATKGHMWEIVSNSTDSSMSISPDSCKSTGPLYEPYGNLSRRLNNINIRTVGNTDTTSKHFLTDLTLPLSGPQAIVNRSLIIRNLDNTTILSCANIEEMKDIALYAQISTNELKGVVNFTQTAGFGAQETIITSSLSGLKSDYRVQISELPPSETNNCANLGSVFNPLEIGNTSTPTTDDTYQIGDISRFFTSQQSQGGSNLNLPLTGLTSILGRSLTVVSSSNVVLACAIIDSSMSQKIIAVSNFTGDVIGSIIMYQRLYPDGSMSDTTLLVDLKNSSGQLSAKHNWHTHMNPVNGDNTASSGRCNSTGPHFDPYKTMANQANYPNECSKLNPLRCETGDQAMKLGTYDLGSGKKLFTDVDLPLSGPFSVLGRSMVLHVKEKGAARLSCADILPKSDIFVNMFIKTPLSLDKRGMAKVYANAIGAASEEVIVEHISSNGGKTEINVYFTGLRGKTLKSSFTSFIKDQNNYKTLSPYDPVAISSSNHVLPSLILIATILSIRSIV